MTDKIVVLTACASEEEANAVARELVEKRLAACVTIAPKSQSLYWWKGAIEHSQEFLLIVKSNRALFGKLNEAILRLHSYETPEILALPVVDGAERYLEWIDRELGQPPD